MCLHHTRTRVFFLFPPRSPPLYSSATFSVLCIVRPSAVARERLVVHDAHAGAPASTQRPRWTLHDARATFLIPRGGDEMWGFFFPDATFVRFLDEHDSTRVLTRRFLSFLNRRLLNHPVFAPSPFTPGHRPSPSDPVARHPARDTGK